MTKKKILIFLIMLITMTTFKYDVYAATTGGRYDQTTINTNPNANPSNSAGGMSSNELYESNILYWWGPSSTSSAINANKLENKANKIIGPIRIIGSVVSVITLIIMGIKYILGSVEEKAEYKKTMVPYIIGAIMVFAITNLLGILVEIVGEF